MQTRERDVRGGRTMHTPKCRRSVFALVPCAVIAALLTMSPAKADFVCNAKTKLVNVFLAPPSYWPATPPQDETALDMRDRLLEEKRRAARGPDVWSPADTMKEPFDLVDTLPSGTRVRTRSIAGLSANTGDWIQIAFRHTQTGLVAQGWVHESKHSSIRCDGDPKTDLSWMEAQDGPGEPRGYRARLEDNFELTVDEPPHEGNRGAKRFEARMPRPADGKISIECGRPREAYTLPKELKLGSDLVDPYILACTRALIENPNYLKALIIRGDLFHRFAKTPASGIDSKSPTWADDVSRRKAAQQRAIADWTRASLFVPKEEIPTLLGDRLAATGAAGYEVK